MPPGRQCANVDAAVRPAISAGAFGRVSNGEPNGRPGFHDSGGRILEHHVPAAFGSYASDLRARSRMIAKNLRHHRDFKYGIGSGQLPCRGRR